jgi:hypothetical protein
MEEKNKLSEKLMKWASTVYNKIEDSSPLTQNILFYGAAIPICFTAGTQPIWQPLASEFGTYNFLKWPEIARERTPEYKSNIMNSMQENFERIDTNNDGLVDLTEQLCYELSKPKATIDYTRQANEELSKEYCSD